MKKKTWGIILVVLGVLGILGGISNGSIQTMGVFELLGFFAGAGICFYFGFKLIKKG